MIIKRFGFVLLVILAIITTPIHLLSLVYYIIRYIFTGLQMPDYPAQLRILLWYHNNFLTI